MKLEIDKKNSIYVTNDFVDYILQNNINKITQKTVNQYIGYNYSHILHIINIEHIKNADKDDVDQYVRHCIDEYTLIQILEFKIKQLKSLKKNIKI